MKKKALSRAVFLDRDGVINQVTDYVTRVSQLTIFRTVGKAIKRLNDLGFDVVVITNQGAIAKGLATHDDVRKIHIEMRRRLARFGAVIDGIYYCPHHPDGTIKRYAVECKCRKPATGLIERASKELGLRLKGSFFVGDTTGDILAGRRAGLTTIVVGTGYGGKDGKFKAKPHMKARDLAAAVKLIEKHGARKK